MIEVNGKADTARSCVPNSNKNQLILKIASTIKKISTTFKNLIEVAMEI